MKKTKKLVVGVLCCFKKMRKEERLMMECAKKKKVELIWINLFGKFDEEQFEKQVQECDIIYNNDSDSFVLEPLKTIEELGKIVIDTSELYYYTEDKWMFYVKAREHHVPTPKTILLPVNATMVRAELKEFGQWPVILKRVYGEKGHFVEKAEDLNEAIAIVKSIWNKDIDKLPLIAQEYVKSDAYRVTIIDGEIVQAIVKKSSHWKHTGVYSGDCERFKIDKKLRVILNKTIRATKIHICGIDILKKGDEWLILEVNAEPGLAFIEKDREKLIGKIFDLIKRYHRKHARHSRK